jgi:hypothetical protein
VDDRADREHHLTDVLADAAVAAEMETGVREDTYAEARSHLLVRLARITAGAVVTLVGLALLVLPGPGMLVVAAGLSILAVDVPFARRLLQQVQDRLPRDSRGGTPRWLLVAGSLGLVGGIAGSLVFALGG